MHQVLPRFDYRVDVHVAEDMGRSRTSHEDAWLLAPELAVFGVADGMGGHAAGEIASRLALDAVREALGDRPARRAAEAFLGQPDLAHRRQLFATLRGAVEHANRAVRESAAAHPEREGMGTTLDVVWMVRDHAFIAHAGDGRVYLARHHALLQLTQDHAQLEVLKAEGKLHPSSHQRGARNRILNAVGLADTVGVDTLFVAVDTGDRVLLCTDGVHGQIEQEARVGELLRQGGAPQAARALVDEAARGGRDNATALVIEVGERFVKRAAGDRGLSAEDFERIAHSPLLAGLGRPAVLAALSAAVEVEFEAGAPIPCVVASDQVAYLILDGLVRSAGRDMAAGGLLFPESLVGVWAGAELPVTSDRARLLRVRSDDFREVCEADPALGHDLFRRLAEHLARLLVRRVSPSAPSAPPPEAGSPASEAPAPPEGSPPSAPG